MQITSMTPWRKGLLYLAVALVFFSLFRLILFVTYRDYFGQLSVAEIVHAFLHGVRFDAVIISVFFAAPLLLQNIPLRFVLIRGWQQFLDWVLWVLLCAMGVVLTADVIYFDFVNRHLATELLAVSQDNGVVLQLVVESYKGIAIAYVLLATGLALLWRRISKYELVPPRYSVLVFVLLLFSLVFTARGWTFHGKPINVVHAFSSGSTVEGNLTLNGLFSSLAAADASRNVNHRFFESSIARQEISESYPTVDGRYPLQRYYEPKQSRRNLVLVLLESWSYRYVDALAANQYGVTPNFDLMVKQGLNFTHAYSAGQRSIVGVQAVLAGIPQLIGMPHLGSGLEVSNISRLGTIAKRNGYRTVFVQSARRGSFRMDAIAQATGFAEYYGMEDIPMQLDYPGGGTSPFGWDYETLMFFSARLAMTKTPFLAVVYTGTTHEPFTRLPARFEKRQHGGLTEDGFLNTLDYADWSIGEFMRAAGKAEWFKNSIFIFVADHPLGKFGATSVIERHHIPLLIYAPGLIKPATNPTVVSQLDLLPTVVDLLGFGDPFSALGESLLRKTDDSALINAGHSVGLISKDGFLTHSLSNRLETGALGNARPSPAYYDALERRLLASDQMVYELLTTNRWAPP